MSNTHGADTKPRIAIVGSGISGLGCAYHLHDSYQVTLFEANNYLGGHAHTVDVTLPDNNGQAITSGVDTGFLVFNRKTYPNLIRLFNELDVSIADSNMSFSAQVAKAGLGGSPLEWNGDTLRTVFAQPSNLLRPRFWRMLSDIVRFNKECTQLAQKHESGTQNIPNITLRQFLAGSAITGHTKRTAYNTSFQEWYLLPMIGCIWSGSTEDMLDFPLQTLIQFCHNHGLIQVSNRPQWLTVKGGSRNYVNAISAHIPDIRLETPVRRIVRSQSNPPESASRQKIQIVTDAGTETFDAVVLACHTDQALNILDTPTEAENRTLRAIPYQRNTAVLHTDTNLMPTRRTAWAAWNYERAPQATQEAKQVCLHYWLNKLQPLPFAQDVFVSLNPARPPADDTIIDSYAYDHPVYTKAALRAQADVAALQGQQNTYFAGAWMGYGFHEDGYKAGIAAAQRIQHDIVQAASKHT